MKTIVVPGVAGLLALVVIGGLAFWVIGLTVTALNDRFFQQGPIVIRSTAPTITDLEKLSQIITHRVHVVDIITAEGNGFEGSWLVKGDALIAVDMSKAVIVDSDKNEVMRRAVISLPQPFVQSPRVDHEKTMKWDIRRTSWIPALVGGDPHRLLEEAMRMAQKTVEDAAASEEFIAPGRERAETIIKSFFAMVGWDVAVEWENLAATKSLVKEAADNALSR